MGNAIRLKREPVTRLNSLPDGLSLSAELWDALDFSRARIDPGPSPAGNPGPYLQVPWPERGTVRRVYPKSLRTRGVAREIERDEAGAWWWGAAIEQAV